MKHTDHCRFPLSVSIIIPEQQIYKEQLETPTNEQQIIFMTLHSPPLSMALRSTAGIGKVQPAGQIRSASSVDPARGRLSLLTLNSAKRLFSHPAEFCRTLIVDAD